jgi:hypothetical protein
MADIQVLVGAPTRQTISASSNCDGQTVEAAKESFDPMKPSLRARLMSFMVVSLLMLGLSVVMWGAVYLLTSARPL